MYRIGIDLGGTNIAAGLVNENRQIVDKCSVKTNAPRPVEALVQDMVRLVQLLMARSALEKRDIAAVGVGVPCTANPTNGHMEDANNLGIADAPFRTVLEEALGLPVYFENDANAAAWGEYQTGDYPEDSFAMVTIGTGIGGALILGGKLWPGINGAAAEFGHMTLKFDGVPCNCGRRGCFEAYASANALIRQAKTRMAESKGTLLWQLCGGVEERVEAKTVFAAAQSGDTDSRALLDRYTDYLSEGIANIINIFQPAIVCIGGGISQAGELLLSPVREKTAHKIYSKNANHNTQIVLAQLTNDAGILGAALLGCDRRNIL